MAVGALLTWLIFGLVVFGLGLPVGVRAAQSRAGALRVALWSGLLVTIVLVSVISLFAPLRGAVALLTVLLLALVAALTATPRFIRLNWSRRVLGWPWLALISGILVVGAVTWALSAMRAPTNYDSGLYHLGAIEYVAQAGTVPGLANLFAPLGYGNVQIPLAALFTSGPMGIEGVEALNSFLLLLLPLDLFLRSYSQPRPRVGALVLAAGIFATYPPMIAMADAWVISPTSDTAVLALTLVAISTLAPTVRSGRVSTHRMLLIVSPLAVAAAMRPQAWLMLVAALAVLAVVRLKLSDQGRRKRHGALVVAALVPPALIAAVGVARDAVLSGWWLYPVNRFPLPVDWRAPDPSALLSSTLGIARDPGPAYQQAAQGYDWLFPWLLRLPQAWEFWLLTSLTATGVVLIILSLLRGQANLTRLLLAATPGIVASLVWLLLTPPSFRFGWGPLVSTAALIFGWGWAANRWADRWIAGFGAVLVLAASVIALVVRIPTWPSSVPEVPTKEVEVARDLVVVSPRDGDQCWNRFPQCTPAPAEGLRLRGLTWMSGFDRGTQPG